MDTGDVHNVQEQENAKVERFSDEPESSEGVEEAHMGAGVVR